MPRFKYKLVGLKQERYENLKFRLSDISKYESLLSFDVEVNKGLYDATICFSQEQKEFEREARMVYQV